MSIVRVCALCDQSWPCLAGLDGVDGHRSIERSSPAPAADRRREGGRLMSKPIRIQLSRRAGWKKPEGAIVVARPTKWGNPYKLTDYKYEGAFDEADARAKAVRDFEASLSIGEGAPWQLMRRDRHELRGKVLACWCRADQLCHADVLLEWANQ